MPIGLYSGSMEDTPTLPEYYTLEWFRNSFIKHFDLVKDEKLEINRHVFVGKISKKDT